MTPTTQINSPTTIPELHVPVDPQPANIAPGVQLFHLDTPEIIGPHGPIPIPPPAPKPINTLPFPAEPAQRAALLQANNLRPAIIADLTRLEGHWYRRIGAYWRLERDVHRLRCNLQCLGYDDRDLPPGPDRFRGPGVCKHAWQPQWAEAVTFSMGQLFSVGCQEEAAPVPVPLPVPIPEPVSDPVVPGPEP